jgi:hypothetical protein
LLPNPQPSLATISVSSFLGANLRDSPPAPESGLTSSLHFSFETPGLGGLFKALPKMLSERTRDARAIKLYAFEAFSMQR